jgi:hypothetical protein
MSERARRILGGVGVGVLVVAAVVGSAFLSFLYGFNCLEGDGEEPYVASNYCSDEQKAAVEEWERSGSRGEPPYDCDTY